MEKEQPFRSRETGVLFCIRWRYCEILWWYNDLCSNILPPLNTFTIVIVVLYYDYLNTYIYIYIVYFQKNDHKMNSLTSELNEIYSDDKP